MHKKHQRKTLMFAKMRTLCIKVFVQFASEGEIEARESGPF
jgi:hypothetical protein